jgi:DNA transposition AAA+ family ATPase
MWFVGAVYGSERIILGETGIVYKRWLRKRIDWDELEDVLVSDKDKTISFLSKGKVKLIISSLKSFENYEDLINQLKAKLGDRLRTLKE